MFLSIATVMLPLSALVKIMVGLLDIKFFVLTEALIKDLSTEDLFTEWLKKLLIRGKDLFLIGSGVFAGIFSKLYSIHLMSSKVVLSLFILGRQKLSPNCSSLCTL